jgi:hypothetical protein
LAKQCKVKLNVQNSFVKHPNPNAIHYDAKVDNLNAMHYIGQAVSFIVHDDKMDKLLCNEICLASINIDDIFIIYLFNLKFINNKRATHTDARC